MTVDLALIQLQKYFYSRSVGLCVFRYLPLMKLANSFPRSLASSQVGSTFPMPDGHMLSTHGTASVGQREITLKYISWF